jgi:hypothetical protein
LLWLLLFEITVDKSLALMKVAETVCIERLPYIAPAKNAASLSVVLSGNALRIGRFGSGGGPFVPQLVPATLVPQLVQATLHMVSDLMLA